MGHYGWETIGLGFSRTLKGTLASIGFSQEDGDWSFYVKPDEGFEWLLVDPAGHSNKSGVVECEVRPSTLDGVTGIYDAVGEGNLHKMCDSWVGRKVVVEGPWVADASHLWDDTDVGAGPAFGFGQPPYNNGKTEIHPVVSILVNRDDLVSHLPGALPVSRFQFMAFVDDNWTHPIVRPTPPPGSGQSWVATFRYPLPGIVSTGLGGPVPKYRIVSEVNDFHASKDITIVTRGDSTFLQGTVITGNTGYYLATVDVYWDSPMIRAPGPGPAGAGSFPGRT